MHLNPREKEDSWKEQGHSRFPGAYPMLTFAPSLPGRSAISGKKCSLAEHIDKPDNQGFVTEFISKYSITEGEAM